MHCTWTWKCTWNCICTLHTTHWTLDTTRHTFILHTANLSLHTETSKTFLSDTQYLHGKLNLITPSFFVCYIFTHWRCTVVSVLGSQVFRQAPREGCCPLWRGGYSGIKLFIIILRFSDSDFQLRAKGSMQLQVLSSWADSIKKTFPDFENSTLPSLF